MVYISASMLDDFIHCPKKVLYRIKKTVPIVETREMILGQAVHSTLEKDPRTREEAYSILDSLLANLKPTQKELTNVRFNLDIFFLNFKQLLTDSDLIEHKFKIQIYDDVFLVGKMDRVAEGCVFDWKTGAIRSKNLSKNIQCIVYDYAYSKMFGKKPNSVFLAGLADGQLYPYIRNELYTKELFLSVVPRLVKTIKSDTFEMFGLFNNSCFRCPYKKGCLGEKNVVDSESFIEE